MTDNYIENQVQDIVFKGPSADKTQVDQLFAQSKKSSYRHTFQDCDIEEDPLASSPSPHDFIFKSEQDPKSVQAEFEKQKKNTNTRGYDLIKIVMAKSYQINFIRNLFQRTYLCKLNHQQKILLDDLKNPKGIDNYQSKQKDQNSFIRRFIFYLRNLPTFEPFTPIIVAWEILVLFVIIIQFFWIPFKLGFGLTNINYFLEIDNSYFFEPLILTIMVFDMVIHTNLSFVSKGNIVKNRKQIIKRYILNQFPIDLLSFISAVYALLSEPSINDIVTLKYSLVFTIIFIVFKGQRLESINQRIEELLTSKGFNSELLNLMQLFFNVIWICHIIACILHGIAYYNNGVTWLTFYNYDQASITTKYNRSFYWGAMTMTTVGYGDIVAQNNLESLCINITMFVACGVFAFSVNSVGIIVQNIHKNSDEYKYKVKLVNSLMIRQKINKDLQQRIRSYLDYIWKEEKQLDDGQLNQIIVKLSRSLQDELQFEIRGSILKNCKAFEKFSDNFLKSASVSMEEVSFSPEEKIFEQDQIDDQSVYIIIKGSVDVCFTCYDLIGNQNTKIYQSLSNDDSFGEISFFTGQQRTATVICSGFTKLYKIKRQDFVHVLQQYPDDFETFNHIKDQIAIYNQLEALKYKCFSCSENDHIIQKCPQIHLKLDKESIVKKLLFPSFQQRAFNITDKQNRTKQRSLLSQRSIALNIAQYQEMLEKQEQSQTDNNSEQNLKDDASEISDQAVQSVIEPSQQESSSNAKSTLNNQFALGNSVNEIQKIKDMQSSSNIETENQSIQVQVFEKNQLVNKNQKNSLSNIEIPNQQILLKVDKNFNTKQKEDPQLNKRSSIYLNNKIIQQKDDKISEARKSVMVRQSQLFIRDDLSPHKKGSLNFGMGSQYLKNETKTEIRESLLNPDLHLQFNMDSYKMYNNYFPLNNVERILKRLNQFYRQNKRKVVQMSQYTFFYLAMMKAMKIRKQLNPENSNLLASKRNYFSELKKKKNSNSNKSFISETTKRLKPFNPPD